jgi:hypothetical protein
MLYKAAGSPEVKVTNAFSDVSSKNSYAKAASWALSKGIIDKTSKKFNGTVAITRGDAFIYTYRALSALSVKIKNGLASDLKKFTDAKTLSSKLTIAAGTLSKLGVLSVGTNAKLRVSAKMTKAEAVVLISNILNKKSSSASGSGNGGSGGMKGGTPPSGAKPSGTPPSGSPGSGRTAGGVAKK